MTGKRSIVIHDYFSIRGGGERLALELANGLGSDLMTAFRTQDSFPEDDFPDGVLDLGLAPPLRRKGLGAVAMAHAFSRAQTRASDYEVRIFSGTCAPFAAPARGAGGRNVLYCHTPPRVLYDKRDYYLAGASPLRRLATLTAGGAFRRAYERRIALMDLIVANSVTVRERIRRYLGRDSIVIHPPCNTEHFRWIEQGGYYLSTARLTGLKRIELIIDAFRRLPGKRLVIASGGDLEATLRARAAGAANIEFTGWVDDTTLADLIGRAIATIYVPKDEDFGMSPVESMSAGKPVIGVAEGGLTETVLDGRTGMLLEPGFDADALAGAIDRMTPSRARDMRHDCEVQAANFTRKHFLEKMHEYALQSREHSGMAMWGAGARSGKRK